MSKHGLPHILGRLVLLPEREGSVWNTLSRKTCEPMGQPTSCMQDDGAGWTPQVCRLPHKATGALWLDVGCGTSAPSQAILDVASPSQITGIDPSKGYLTFVHQQIRDHRVSFRLGDAQALPEAAGS